MQYFIRFVGSPEQAQADFERGFSYAGYMNFSTAESAQEWADEMSMDDPTIEPMDIGGYGVALDGLCGFGPYATEAEAEADAIERGGYNSVGYDYAAIFTGRHIGQADNADGDLFRAVALVKTVSLN